MTDLKKLEQDLARMWTNAIFQHGPNSLTMIVRREWDADQVNKCRWAANEIETASVLADPGYSSFGSHRTVATFSVTWWKQEKENPA